MSSQKSAENGNGTIQCIKSCKLDLRIYGNTNIFSLIPLAINAYRFK